MAKWYTLLCILLIVVIAETLTEDYVYVITNESFQYNVGFSRSTFSLQTAALPSAGGSYVHLDPIHGNSLLFIDACEQPGKTHNCTVSCNDPAMMFENLETLHNCMVYPVVAYQYSNKSLFPTSIQWLEDLGIVATETNPRNSFQAVQILKCLTEYCSASSRCKQEYDTFANLSGDIYSVRAGYWTTDHYGGKLVRAICDSYTYPINSDVGGIGVCSKLALGTPSNNADSAIGVRIVLGSDRHRIGRIPHDIVVPILDLSHLSDPPISKVWLEACHRESPTYSDGMQKASLAYGCRVDGLSEGAMLLHARNQCCSPDRD